ncbi:hypothetical protein [Streptomyces sp. NPDC059874]|uniref:hypothetical protein n=1 Tax=Streptomyces sp. NPDC059874 TaxID=3346983 RepID=UPI003663A507
MWRTEQFGDAIRGVGDDGEFLRVQSDQSVAVLEVQESGVAGHVAADVAEATGELVVDGLVVELFFKALAELPCDGDVRLEAVEVSAVGCGLSWPAPIL